MKYFLLLLLCTAQHFLPAQVNPGLENILQLQFPADTAKKQELIFYKDKANIERLDYPVIKKYLPNYELYAVNLTFKPRPGWVNRCVVLYDSAAKDFILQQSLTMGGLNPKLEAVLQSLQFNDSSSLLQFINSFHSLRQLGSKCKFIPTAVTDTLLSYDIVWFDDQDYINKPYHDTRQTKYDFAHILGKLYIEIENNRITTYKELNKKVRYSKR